jgi:hypothetical protein
MPEIKEHRTMLCKNDFSLIKYVSVLFCLSKKEPKKDPRKRYTARFRDLP